MKDDQLYLIYILECIERIERYATPGQTLFLADTMIQDAVLRNLHTLAESTQRLSDDLKVKHPQVEWAQIAAFRNVVVHNYLGIDLFQIWDIVSRDLPNLKRQVKPILAALDKTSTA
jgi:uncharacterized protein with HEPN domain